MGKKKGRNKRDRKKKKDKQIKSTSCIITRLVVRITIPKCLGSNKEKEGKEENEKRKRNKQKEKSQLHAY